SANTGQLLWNQALSLAVFLLLARQLGKPEFGALNGLLAFLLLAFGILSFGIDQLLVRKAAAGGDSDAWLSTALVHYASAALLFYGLLLLTYFLLPGLAGTALLLLAAGKGLQFLGQPFKSIVNGQERFRRLLGMSVAANTVKALGLWLLYRQGHLTLPNTVWVFAAADALEAATCVGLYLQGGGRIRWQGASGRYKTLMTEAAPQLGTTVFAAALARFDWLFLAALCPAAIVAEYSFAYKAFELAQLPLLAIAPLLVPRFTRLLQRGAPPGALKKLLRTECVLAGTSMLLLNAAWVPVADWISGGKYGAACRVTVFILSLSLPLLYYNNFLWSLHFAQGRTGLIFRLFALTFAVNAAANALLVPLWQKEGAAASFVFALLLQTFLYHYYAQPGWRGRLRWRPEATGTS
ncbi:MAG: hypothetical protein EOO12_13025, partial [Chitinophagaceae bacterium]